MRWNFREWLCVMGDMLCAFCGEEKGKSEGKNKEMGEGKLAM